MIMEAALFLPDLFGQIKDLWYLCAGNDYLCQQQYRKLLYTIRMKHMDLFLKKEAGR